MKRTTFTEHIDAFKTEARMLLRFQFAFNRISKFDDIQSMSSANFFDSLISLKAIENDMVIRICKFDDDTKGVHSFSKAVLEIPAINPNKAEIEKKVKQFRQLIDNVKKERRHTQLAHLKMGDEDNQYEICYNLTPAIKSIVDIIDLMKNDKVNYYWRERGKKFDLRNEVLNEQTEIK